MKAEIKKLNSEKKGILCVEFRGKTYKIQKEKLLKVLELLSDKTIYDSSKNNLLKLIKYYKLFDEAFFENINKL